MPHHQLCAVYESELIECLAPRLIAIESLLYKKRAHVTGHLSEDFQPSWSS